MISRHRACLRVAAEIFNRRSAIRTQVRFQGWEGFRTHCYGFRCAKATGSFPTSESFRNINLTHPSVQFSGLLVIDQIEEAIHSIPYKIEGNLPRFGRAT